MQPVISVIVPAYNAAETLRQTIESVLAQTFRDLELIVVDDGSTDGTAMIVQELSDNRVRLVTGSNQGPAASRNRGLSVCKGDFVSFLDADDLWTPEKLADQLDVLRRHSWAGIAYSWTDYIDDNGRWLCRGGYHANEGDVYGSMLAGDFLESGSNALIRRTVAEHLGGFDEQAPIGAEDWEYYIRAARFTKFACTRKPQVLYRVRQGSVSAHIEAQRAGLIAMIEKSFAQAPAHLMHLRRKSMAHIHMYLAQKALDCSRDPKRIGLCLRLLTAALRMEPVLLVQTQLRAIAITLAKALAMWMLPEGLVWSLRNKVRRHTNHRRTGRFGVPVPRA